MDKTGDGCSGIERLANWLEEKHGQIMACENEGIDILKSGDSEGYKAKMRLKAEMLRDLHRESMPLLSQIGEGRRWDIERGIERFSASAATALSLNSPFYMSALLYPDEHKPGEPDNLMIFIADIRRECRG